MQFHFCSVVIFTENGLSQRSGWKSLFCVLRGIQLDESSGNLLQAVSDVYEAYLSSDTIRVFSSSLWECVQSLLKLYRTARKSSTAADTLLVHLISLLLSGHVQPGHPHSIRPVIAEIPQAIHQTYVLPALHERLCWISRSHPVPIPISTFSWLPQVARTHTNFVVKLGCALCRALH